MKGFTRTETRFSLCGLNCALCSMHLGGCCPGCGVVVTEVARYCPECGARLPKAVRRQEAAV